MEIAVAGSQTDSIRSGTNVISDAEPAGILENARTRSDQFPDKTFVCKHFHNLPGPWSDSEAHAVMDLTSLEHQRDGFQIAIRGVRAGADHHLVDGIAFEAADGFDIPRLMRCRTERLHCAQIKFDRAVVYGVRIRG